jgi:hypothetical protein
MDKVLGRVLDRLEASSLYDRSLIVVTADHGISFRARRQRRNFGEDTAAEIMRIPLVIKFPKGARGPTRPPITQIAGQIISDQNVETIDIAPTVADALGVELPWRADGTSLLDPVHPERESKRMFFDGARHSRFYAATGPDIGPALRRKLEIFGGTENLYRVPRPPRFGELVGHPVDQLRVAEGGGDVEVESVSLFTHVNLKSDAVPFDVAGRLQRQPSGKTPAYVAVAVNGTIQAVTRTWANDPRKWLATPPLDAWHDGRNNVAIFVVEKDARGPLLRRTRLVKSKRG